MQDTNVMAAFISTNSIIHGEPVANIFKPLFDRIDIEINFAWRSFKWDSESKSKSSVYCLTIGFSTINKTFKKLFFDNNNFCEVKNINTYLNIAPNIFIESRNKPICHAPEIIYENKPVDGGNLLLSDKEYRELESVYINLKESQIHKDTTNINRSDKSIECFSVSGGNTVPTLKRKRSIFDNMSKAIKFTVKLLSLFFKTLKPLKSRFSSLLRFGGITDFMFRLAM